MFDHNATSAPHDLLAALRSDHAGETGAVWIYTGILAVARDQDLRRFASQHRVTELQHLDLMEQILSSEQRSRLLPLWRFAGWLTGALPAAVGPAAVYRTIDAVESFVDEHYARQIEALQGRPEHQCLRNKLERCRADEIEHRNQARDRLAAPGIIGRLWKGVVGLGSRAGVYVASRL